MNTTKTLRELVELAVTRHATSVRQLSFLAQKADFRVVSTTLNQIRNGTYKSAPTDDTIKAIAWLAGVSEEVAFTAAGQTVPGPPLADELPPGADNLSPKSRKVVLDMVRVLVDLEAGNHDTQDKPNADQPSERPHGAVVGGSGFGKGQKIGPGAKPLGDLPDDEVVIASDDLWESYNETKTSGPMQDAVNITKSELKRVTRAQDRAV